MTGELWEGVWVGGGSNKRPFLSEQEGHRGVALLPITGVDMNNAGQSKQHHMLLASGEFQSPT